MKFVSIPKSNDDIARSLTQSVVARDVRKEYVKTFEYILKDGLGVLYVMWFGVDCENIYKPHPEDIITLEVYCGGTNFIELKITLGKMLETIRCYGNK
jgi:hypothetical protein